MDDNEFFGRIIKTTDEITNKTWWECNECGKFGKHITQGSACPRKPAEKRRKRQMSLNDTLLEGSNDFFKQQTNRADINPLWRH